MTEQAPNTHSLLETAREAESLVLVFKQLSGFKVGKPLLRLVYMGSKKKMEKELHKMLENRTLTQVRTLHGIDYKEVTKFEVSVKKDKKGFHLSTIYIARPKSKI